MTVKRIFNQVISLQATKKTLTTLQHTASNGKTTRRNNAFVHNKLSINVTKNQWTDAKNKTTLVCLSVCLSSMLSIIKQTSRHNSKHDTLWRLHEYVLVNWSVLVRTNTVFYHCIQAHRPRDTEKWATTNSHLSVTRNLCVRVNNYNHYVLCQAYNHGFEVGERYGARVEYGKCDPFSEGWFFKILFECRQWMFARRQWGTPNVGWFYDGWHSGGAYDPQKCESQKLGRAIPLAQLKVAPMP